MIKVYFKWYSQPVDEAMHRLTWQRAKPPHCSIHLCHPLLFHSDLRSALHIYIRKLQERLSPRRLTTDNFLEARTHLAGEAEGGPSLPGQMASTCVYLQEDQWRVTLSWLTSVYDERCDARCNSPFHLLRLQRCSGLKQAKTRQQELPPLRRFRRVFTYQLWLIYDSVDHMTFHLYCLYVYRRRLNKTVRVRTKVKCVKMCQTFPLLGSLWSPDSQQHNLLHVFTFEVYFPQTQTDAWLSERVKLQISLFGVPVMITAVPVRCDNGYYSI